MATSLSSLLGNCRPNVVALIVQHGGDAGAFDHDQEADGERQRLAQVLAGLEEIRDRHGEHAFARGRAVGAADEPPAVTLVTGDALEVDLLAGPRLVFHEYGGVGGRGPFFRIDPVEKLARLFVDLAITPHFSRPHTGHCGLDVQPRISMPTPISIFRPAYPLT